jgi:hypothetical protein
MTQGVLGPAVQESDYPAMHGVCLRDFLLFMRPFEVVGPQNILGGLFNMPLVSYQKDRFVCPKIQQGSATLGQLLEVHVARLYRQA